MRAPAKLTTSLRIVAVAKTAIDATAARRRLELAGLLGNRVSDDMREKFRAQIEASHQRRAAAEQAPEEQPEPGTLERLKGIFGRLGPKKN